MKPRRPPAPPPAAPRRPAAAVPPVATASRQLLMTVWCPRPGEFAARVVLADGTLHDFDSPFELLRFLSRPTSPPAPTPGLR